MKKLLGIAVLFAALAFGLTACNNDADVVSRNLSVDADNFKVQRRIIFINGITDKYLLVVEGLCSIGNDDKPKRMSVTCKTGPRDFKKHFLGISDNVTFVGEQLEANTVSPYHYKVIFKPQSILPDFEFKGDADELKKAVTPGSAK